MDQATADEANAAVDIIIDELSDCCQFWTGSTRLMWRDVISNAFRPVIENAIKRAKDNTGSQS